MTTLSFTPELAWRFPRGVTAIARLPVLYRDFFEPSRAARQTRFGIGDLELLAGLEPFGLANVTAPWAAQWRPSVSVGVALPTGSIDPDPQVGLLAPTILQLGNGTVDPLVALGCTYSDRSRWTLDASVSARIALMTNAAGFQPPTALTAIAGAQFRPIDAVALEWHLEGAVLTRAFRMGVPAASTGRVVLYAVPAVEFRAGQSVRISAALRLPIMQHVEDTQLAETYSALLRIAYIAPALGR